MKTLRLFEWLTRERLGRETTEYLRTLAHEPREAARRNTTGLLAQLRAERGVKLQLGETMWGEPIVVPLIDHLGSHAVCEGTTGGGKTMAVLPTAGAIIELKPDCSEFGLGELDCKEDMFQRTLYLLAARLSRLDEQAQEALLKRVCIIDLGQEHAISSFNVLARPANADPDFFLSSRAELLQELWPSSDRLSLRGSVVLRKAMDLLSEFNLPLTYVDLVLGSETLRQRLLARSRNAAIRAYFQQHFPQEGKQTIAALRARLDALLASRIVRLTLGGPTAPDFRRLMNDGYLVLLNTAGPNVSRGVRTLIQSLIVQNIRTAVFTRPIDPSCRFVWLLDESQNLFQTQAMRDAIFDLLGMARSYGTFFHFLTQSISAAVPDARLLHSLYTNIGWAMVFRGEPSNALFLRPALPVTGRMRRPRTDPFHDPGAYTLQEERNLLLESIAALPNRHAFLWLRTRSAEAIRMRTRTIHLPQGDRFRAIVDALRCNPQIGGRLSRAEYERLIEARDREWLGGDTGGGDLQERLAQAYRR